MKKLLSFALIIMLALSFATPVQAATKKVTAEAYEKDKTDYPAIKEGTTKITLKCEKWNGYGCIKFKANPSLTSVTLIRSLRSEITAFTSIHLMENSTKMQSNTRKR